MSGVSLGDCRNRGTREVEESPLNKVKDVVPASAQPAKGGKGKSDDTDHELEGLMSEIETDLRTDEFKKIWNKYGTVFVALGAMLILGVTGFQLYRQYDDKQLGDVARRYELAIAAQQEGKTDDAIAQFGALTIEGRKGYGTLARLSQAALLLEKKDFDGAIANYKAVAADPEADPIFRDLATLLRVLHGLDREDPKLLEAALTPLTNPSNAFNLSALELSALLAAKQGDTARAVKTLAQISADPGTPASMRDRADDLTKLYQAGVVPPPPAAPTIPAPAAAPAVSPAPSPAPAKP